MELFRLAYLSRCKCVDDRSVDMVIRALDGRYENLTDSRYFEMIKNPKYDRGFLDFVTGKNRLLRKEFERVFTEYCMRLLNK